MPRARHDHRGRQAKRGQLWPLSMSGSMSEKAPLTPALEARVRASAQVARYMNPARNSFFATLFDAFTGSASWKRTTRGTL